MRHGSSADTPRLVLEQTQRFMLRNGLRALRVDELVARLGISKRTLYGLFGDKTSLIDRSLGALFEEWDAAIGRRCDGGEPPLVRACGLVDELVCRLDSAGLPMLRELHDDEERRPLYAERMRGWAQRFGALLDEAVAAGCCDSRTDCGVMARGLLLWLDTARLQGLPPREQSLFALALLRGIATPAGLDGLDGRAAEG